VTTRSTALAPFHPAVREWFAGAFAEPTPAQIKGWTAIARGDSTLLLAPTGSGKTLAAFLWCLNRLMFDAAPLPRERCRVLYVSPLKALAVDVERNLRAPIAGITNQAALRGESGTIRVPNILVRTGDTPAAERARFQRDPADIVITTPESLYLMLTSNAREALRSVDTLIIDEIHALVPTKRGAHLALSIERLEALVSRPLQRIGLSATQRPLDEVARFLGGTNRSTTPQPRAQAAVPTRANQTGKAVKRHAPAPSDDGEIAAREIHDEFAGDQTPIDYRPVTIVDAGSRKALRLRIEVPVEDMAKLAQPIDIPSGPASQAPKRPSIWTAIHPRLLELVRAHRSTLIFVNNRRSAERLAAALNELAGEPLTRAHHGSLARDQRLYVEDSLKAGTLRGLVATSSLELGIDMGAIDLVVQIEAPPSVASGLQRIGRAGHHVDAISEGVIFPKYRGDLVACATATRSMHEGKVESTRYPRNPLDVLAQQIVAMASMDRWTVDDLYALIRRAAPFAALDRTIFEGLLDMLAGRYPSDDFAELRPRITWDRVHHTIVAREGAKRVAIANGGTIPDRGLYGVFLAEGPRGGARVGELDEEMVFESRPGETFLLGASTWRIEEITHDRVLVTPAPGEPGKMPFWRGEAVGRPLEFGRAIGALVRTLADEPPAAALERLERLHDLDRRAGENLLQYLDDQRRATGQIPDDRTIVIERTRDELGDWRVCLLTPLGGQILAPWSMAVLAKIQEEHTVDVETLWTDDGLVVRFPEMDDPPDPALLLPDPDDVERLVLKQLGGTSLFAAKFREAAARALLLPRRRIGGRTPLWQQRKRAADLLKVASRFGSFPIVLEAYRECLRDLFDLPALIDTLRQIRSRQIRVTTVDSTAPSPFASALLFGYVANYLYEGDAPLAERRAQALAIDPAQLRALLGDAELRELLDPDAIDAVEALLQYRDPTRHVKSADSLHDLLLRIGDLTPEEIAARWITPASASAAAAIDLLTRERRAIPLTIGGERRFVAVEDANRYRDVLGTPLPQGLPDALLAAVRDPVGDLVLRYARTHAPFTTRAVADRFGLGRAIVETTLQRVASTSRVLEGEFCPGSTEREWCEPGVLSQIRRRSLAKLRKEVEPVEPAVFGRLVTTWQGVVRKRRGLDALLDVVESLEGAPLPASLIESEILPARIDEYRPGDLDTLLAAGEVVWCGLEPIGERDGRVALFLTDHLSRLWRPRAAIAAAAASASALAAASASASASTSLPSPRPAPRKRGEAERASAKHDAADDLGERERAILDWLRAHGASFFTALHDGVGGGFPAETVDALWTLVWRGAITNDSWQALRAYVRGTEPQERRARPLRTGRPAFRSRRQVPPAGEGRWSLMETRVIAPVSPTEWSAAIAQQLLARYGLITREVAAAEALPGGFSAVYDVLKALEDSGRIRRGYFVAGISGAQFALPAALDLLRSLRDRDRPDEADAVLLAATDPANPYGVTLKWPDQNGATESVATDGDASAATAGQGGGADTRSAVGVGVAGRGLRREHGGTRGGSHARLRGDGDAGARAADTDDQARADDGAARGGMRGPTRSVGAQVVIVDGQLAGYLGRGRQLLVYLPDAEPDRSRTARALSKRLADIARTGEGRVGGLLIGEIDGVPAPEHPLAPFLIEAGFVRSGLGFQVVRERHRPLERKPGAARWSQEPAADSADTTND
jgi:ATP-dependent Lhr-like helicase